MAVKNFGFKFHVNGYQADGVTIAQYQAGPLTGQDMIDVDPNAAASSVALGNGIFLTASHIFDHFQKGSSGQVVRFIANSISINGQSLGANPVKNLEGWNSVNVNTTGKITGDLAELKTSVPVASSDISSLVVFADQHAVTRVLTGQTITNGGSVSQNSGAFVGLDGTDRFSANLVTHSGDSGGAAAVSIAGTQYVAGILSSGTTLSDNTNPNNPPIDIAPSYYSYVNLKSFYTTMNDVATGGSQDFSTVAPDLIYGEDDKEYVRGTVKKSDIILNGNSDIILASGNGDVVNTGLGNHDVIFTAAANGGVDHGTTFIFGPGNSTIIGGNANDRLAIPADRLWNKNTGLPTATGLSANSNLIFLTGGTSNAPDAQIGSWVGPHLPPAQYTAEEPATPALANSTNPTDWLIDDYDYFVDYLPQQNANGSVDLTVEVGASDPTQLFAPLLWRSSVVIKNYHAGDFGLTFTVDTSYADNQNGLINNDQYYAERLKAMSAFVSQPVASQYAVDDTTTNWSGHNTFWAPETLSDATIASDLTTVLKATQAPSGGTTAASASRLAQAMSTFDTGSSIDTGAPLSAAAIAPHQMLAANSSSSVFMHQHHA